MNDNIKIFYGEAGLRKISRFLIEDDDLMAGAFIAQWAVEERKCCFIYYESEIPVAFILLSDLDYDPLNGHRRPRLLNFIYTSPPYRRMGYASKLLDFTRSINIRFTAFCSNTISENLFKKKGFLYKPYANGSPMFRAPDDL